MSNLVDYLAEVKRRGYDTQPSQLFDDALIEAYDHAQADWHRYTCHCAIDLEIARVAADRLQAVRVEIIRRMKR